MSSSLEVFKTISLKVVAGSIEAGGGVITSERQKLRKFVFCPSFFCELVNQLGTHISLC